MNPALIEALLEVRRRADAAGHGGKSAVYAAASAELGIPRATLMRRLARVRVATPRKRRSDAGATALAHDDARRLSAQMMQGFRGNDKHIQSLKLSLEQLRAEQPLFAHVIDAETGEARALSDSACARALRRLRLHPDQLRQPDPVQRLASDHPNDVWQIDASISTLFYVPEGGVEAMDKAVFYKNKPGNFERIRRQRLTRYVITDHCSGSIFVHYVAGGESTSNMAAAFLAAIAPRPGQQMYGVPLHLMMDPGSAGTAGAFGNLLRRLQVAPIVNQAGNARAKGQVENAHNLVELGFESGFKFTHVPDIDWINAKAALWMRHYNSVRVHGRHGLTRWAKWMEITPAQLRLVDVELARLLLTHAPATPKVAPDLSVRFAGRVWDLRDVPGLMVGEKVEITYNPFDAAQAWLVQVDADGAELLRAVPELARDAHGFAVGAARIGHEIKALADTPAVTNRKLVERLAMGVETDAEAAAARRAKALPFGGQHDPYAYLEQGLPAATPLPRRGTALATGARVAHAAQPTLTLFAAAAALARPEHLGAPLSAAQLALLRQLQPDGVAEDQLPDLARRLAARGALRVVGSDQ